jgi:tetratricopeptide (TPR) repeat protein
MSDRLTRKEMKRQDTFQTFMSRGLDFVQIYRRQLIGGVAILVLLVVGLISWLFYEKSQEKHAQSLLGQAIEAYGAPIKGESTQAESSKSSDEVTFPTEKAREDRAKELFESVRDKYGLSEAADVADVYLGEIAAHHGETDKARKLWSDFVDEHPDHMLTTQVRLNLYDLDRANGKGEEVAKELQAMLDRQEKPMPEDVILYELAVTLEGLGRKQEAQQHYQRLVSEFSESPYAQVARQKVGGAAGTPTFPGLPS